MPVIIWAAILEVEVGSTRTERNVKSIEPAMTKMCVLIPAALPLDSLSMPSRKPAMRQIVRSMRNMISSFAAIINGITSEKHFGYKYVSTNGFLKKRFGKTIRVTLVAHWTRVYVLGISLFFIVYLKLYCGLVRNQCKKRGRGARYLNEVKILLLFK